MDLKRLTGKMMVVMYADGKFSPVDRNRIIGFVEDAWKKLEAEAGVTEKEVITCPDCGLDIEYDVVRRGAMIVTYVPGACPRCGSCLK